MEANMDSPQPHSTATKALEVLSAALTIIRRLFLLLIVYPAVGFFLLMGLASDWSFTGAGKWLTDMQYEAQQLGKAEAPGHLLVKRCADESRSRGAMPEPVATCDAWQVKEVAVEALAKEGGRTLALIYCAFLVTGFGVMVFTSPASPLRLRERLGLQRPKPPNSAPGPKTKPRIAGLLFAAISCARSAGQRHKMLCYEGKF